MLEFQFYEQSNVPFVISKQKKITWRYNMNMPLESLVVV